MKKLTRFFGGYVKESILGPLLKLLEATLELIVPLVIAAIIDNGIKANGYSGDKAYIVKMSLLLVLLGAVGLIFSVTAQYFSAKASVGFTSRMRSALFSHIGTLSYSDIDTLGADSRGAKRIVFSYDGLIYYTDDHYESFTQLY